MKEIPGYKPLLIDETGVVMNADTNHVLKPYIDNHGYYRVQHKFNGKHKTMLVHRLLAITFIPNPDNLPIINHIDGNPQNNSITNLEWCTQMHNVTHAALTLGTMKQYQEFNKKHQKKIQGIYPDGSKTKIYESVGDAARDLKLHKPNIFCAVKRHIRCGGLYWEYSE